MPNDPVVEVMQKFSSLTRLDVERHMLEGIVEDTCHPERKAKASLLNAVTSLVFVLLLLVVICAGPVVIYAWSRLI